MKMKAVRTHGLHRLGWVAVLFNIRELQKLLLAAGGALAWAGLACTCNGLDIFAGPVFRHAGGVGQRAAGARRQAPVIMLLVPIAHSADSRRLYYDELVRGQYEAFGPVCPGAHRPVQLR